MRSRTRCHGHPRLHLPPASISRLSVIHPPNSYNNRSNLQYPIRTTTSTPAPPAPHHTLHFISAIAQNFCRIQNPYSHSFHLNFSIETMPETYVESVTGVKFPSTFSFPGSDTKLAFAGAGVREKKVAFINVKVYAVALYVDPRVKAALSSWQGQSQLNNAAFFNSVVNAPVQKALQLVLVRDITGAQFWGALDESLRPRLRAARAGEAGDKALADLGRVFQSRPLSTGTTITLNWVHPSTLQVGSAFSPLATPTFEASVENKALVSSIFDIYVGDQPISPSAKSQFAVGLASFV